MRRLSGLGQGSGPGRRMGHTSCGAGCWQRSSALAGGVAVSMPTLVSTSFRRISMFSPSRLQHKCPLSRDDPEMPSEGCRVRRIRHEANSRGSALSCYIQAHTSRSRRRGFERSRDIRSHGIWPQFRKESLRVVATSSSPMETHCIRVAFGALARAHWP